MSTVEIISAILSLLAGIGIFLVACGMMSSNLEALGSNYLRKLFSSASRSKLLGIGIGTVGTAAIQSSGATTVMVIGFVNAGIMTLTQAATIVFGANIGTTITGQIVALGLISGNSISTTVIFSALAGVGAFMSSFSKKDRLKTIGSILAGFGMLFVGLSMMSQSMDSFAHLEAVRVFLSSIQNIILLVLIGALLTAIIQSSSVMTSIAITMVVAGLITLDQGIYLTMGSNIGSCVVAIMASITGGKNAKRTALIHLIFNVSGVIVFLLLGQGLALFSAGRMSFGSIISSIFPQAPQTQLAMFHTIFNVLTVIIIFPLTELLVRFVTRLIPDDPAKVEEKKTAPRTYYIDNNMLKTPPIAIAQAKNEIINMAEISMRNYQLSLHMICELDISEKKSFKQNEKELNFLNKELVRFLASLSSMKLSDSDHRFITKAFHSINDLERVGDYAENIMEYAEQLIDLDVRFTEDAILEIQTLEKLMEDLFTASMKAYIDNDLEAFKTAKLYESQVDIVTNEMAENHIERLKIGKCTPEVGARYLSLASNSERVADHIYNVAKTVRNK